MRPLIVFRYSSIMSTDLGSPQRFAKASRQARVWDWCVNTLCVSPQVEKCGSVGFECGDTTNGLADNEYDVNNDQ